MYLLFHRTHIGIGHNKCHLGWRQHRGDISGMYWVDLRVVKMEVAPLKLSVADWME